MQRNTTQQHHTNAGPALPRDPEQALKTAINCIMALEDVYKRENETLSQTDTKGFMSLQNEKLEKAHSYQNTIQQIIQRKEEIKKANPALKNELKAIQSRFSDLASKNLQEIERMQRTVGRLGETIRLAAKKAATTTHNVRYSETGLIDNNEKRSVSMGINETA